MSLECSPCRGSKSLPLISSQVFVLGKKEELSNHTSKVSKKIFRSGRNNQRFSAEINTSEDARNIPIGKFVMDLRVNMNYSNSEPFASESVANVECPVLPIEFEF